VTTLTFVASGTTAPDNWNLISGASKVAAVATPDDGNTTYISSTTTDENVQTFTASPSLPSGATISQVAIRVRAQRGGASNAAFVVGYSFAKQGGGTQSGESGTLTSTSSYADYTYTHSGLSANWGSGFTFYLRNTQTRAVYVTTVEVELTYTALVIAPSGLAVGAAFGSATVWPHKIVKSVATGNDDARETVATGEVLLIPTVFAANITYRSGMIIRDVLVPPGASVTSSYIQVYVPFADDPGLTIRGEINPADFTTTNYDISSRTLTTAGVSWTASNIGTGSYKNSPDISAVIQEIIDDEAWAAGDDIGLFITDNGTGGDLTADSANFTNGPRLVIEWGFGVPEQDIAPSGLAVAKAIGTAAVGRGAVGIAPSGLAVAKAIGGATVGRGAVNIAPAGKAVTVGKGTATLVLHVAPAGKAVTVAAGSARVANVVAPSGLAVAAGLGDATVGRGAVAIAPDGLAVAAEIGGAVVTTTGALIRPDGLAVAAASGDATVTPGAVGVTASGLAVGVEIGTGKVGLGITGAGLAVGLDIGDAAVAGGEAVIRPDGLAVAAAVGTAQLRSHRLELAISEDATETAVGTIIPLATSINVNVDVPHAGFRVVNPPIPGGVVVQTAYLRLYTNVYDDPALELACELSAAPAAITTTQFDISNRTPTESTAPWVATDIGSSGFVNSPDFGAAAKEVIDLPEWVEGESDLFVILRDLGAGGWLRTYSVDGGASFRPSLVLVWAWSEATLTIGPLGKAVAVGIGDAEVAGGSVGIAADGLAVGIAIGDATVAGGVVDIAPEGLEVTAAFGDAAVSGGLEDIAPEGLEVTVALGDAAVGFAVAPGGLAVAVAVGGLVVGRGAMGITAEGLAVAAGLGEPVVSAGGAVVQASGLAVAATAGTAVIGRGGVGITVEGLAVAVGVGSADVRPVIAPDGLEVGVVIGDAAVGLRVAVGGLAVAVGVGSAAVGRGAAVIAPDGLAVGATAGSAVLARGGVGIAPEGLAVAVESGTAGVNITTQYVRPAGMSVGAIWGTLLVIAATTPATRIYRVPPREAGN